MLNAKEIVDKMLKNDSFSSWLEINIIDLHEGYCKISLKINESMLNGFSIAHGGISYSLADSALAFAANSYGKKAVSIETSISHIKKVNNHDTLIAETNELNKTNKNGLYAITITNQENLAVAYFKGTVYFSEKNWN